MAVLIHLVKYIHSKQAKETFPPGYRNRADKSSLCHTDRRDFLRNTDGRTGQILRSFPFEVDF